MKLSTWQATFSFIIATQTHFLRQVWRCTTLNQNRKSSWLTGCTPNSIHPNATKYILPASENDREVISEQLKSNSFHARMPLLALCRIGSREGQHTGLPPPTTKACLASLHHGNLTVSYKEATPENFRKCHGLTMQAWFSSKQQYSSNSSDQMQKYS